MGYFKTKLSLYFKNYENLKEKNLLTLDKENYSSDTDNINESIKSCKTSVLKVVLTILSIPLILISLYFLYHLIFIYIFHLDSNKFHISLGVLDNYIYYIYIFFIPLITIFYLLSCFDITIRKSKYLRILTIIAVIIWIIFNAFFIYYVLQIGKLDID